MNFDYGYYGSATPYTNYGLDWQDFAYGQQFQPQAYAYAPSQLPGQAWTGYGPAAFQQAYQYYYPAAQVNFAPQAFQRAAGPQAYPAMYAPVWGQQLFMDQKRELAYGPVMPGGFDSTYGPDEPGLFGLRGNFFDSVKSFFGGETKKEKQIEAATKIAQAESIAETVEAKEAAKVEIAKATAVSTEVIVNGALKAAAAIAALTAIAVMGKALAGRKK